MSDYTFTRQRPLALEVADALGITPSAVTITDDPVEGYIVSVPRDLTADEEVRVAGVLGARSTNPGAADAEKAALEALSGPLVQEFDAMFQRRSLAAMTPEEAAAMRDGVVYLSSRGKYGSSR